MKKITAVRITLALLSLLVIFHALVLLEIVPYEMVWAGRLESVEEMWLFETISILINLVMIMVFEFKYGQLRKGKASILIDVFIWIIVVFFVLNTFGNLLSKTLIEFVLGTLLTLTLAVLSIVVVGKKRVGSNKQAV